MMENTVINNTKDLAAVQAETKQLHEMYNDLSKRFDSLQNEVREQQRVDDAHAERLAQICEQIENLQRTFDDLAKRLGRQATHYWIMVSVLTGLLLGMSGLFSSEALSKIVKSVFGL